MLQQVQRVANSGKPSWLCECKDVDSVLDKVFIRRWFVVHLCLRRREKCWIILILKPKIASDLRSYVNVSLLHPTHALRGDSASNIRKDEDPVDACRK
jgi:hypothetical protein